jgi:hypothetical protein
MPIVYPAKIVEKVKEVIKEVIKAVGFSPSVSMGMEYSLIVQPPLPAVISSFGVDVGLVLYSLYNYTTPIGPFQIVSNPALPSPTFISSFSLTAYGEALMGSKPSISTSIVSAPERPIRETIASFDTSVGVRKSP